MSDVGACSSLMTRPWICSAIATVCVTVLLSVPMRSKALVFLATTIVMTGAATKVVGVAAFVATPAAAALIRQRVL